MNTMEIIPMNTVNKLILEFFILLSIVPCLRRQGLLFFLPLRSIAYGGYYRHGPDGVATFYDGWLFTTIVGRALFPETAGTACFGRVRFSLLKNQLCCTLGFL